MNAVNAVNDVADVAEAPSGRQSVLVPQLTCKPIMYPLLLSLSVPRSCIPREATTMARAAMATLHYPVLVSQRR